MKKLVCILVVLCLSCVALLAALAEPTLHIVGMRSQIHSGFDARYNSALDALQAKYPGVRVFHRSAGALGGPGWRDAMLAGNENIDILCLATPDLPTFIDSGAIAPLSEHSVAAAVLAQWPGPDDLTGRDGLWYAVPQMTIPRLCRVAEPEIYEALGLHPEEDWLWEDLFNMAPALQAYNLQHGTAYPLVYAPPYAPYLLQQFAGNLYDKGSLTPQQEAALRGVLIGWKSLATDGLVWSGPVEQAPGNALFSFDFPPQGWAQQGHGQYLPAPAYAQDVQRSEVSTLLYMVNAKAASLDIAMDFLAAYYQPEAAASSPWYQAHGVWPGGAAQGTPAGVDAQRVALWQEALQQGFPPISYYADLLAGMHALYLAYEADGITLDECVQGITALVEAG